MNPWSNIEVPPDDAEIVRIDRFEAALGKIPLQVNQIRQLITGFEVCHYKYSQHIKYIKGSISDLKPNIILEDIGRNHLRHGTQVIGEDRSGRSLSGQTYVLTLKKWLGDPDKEFDLKNHEELYNKITRWLGTKDQEKERLVRLLIARLKWDWKSYESLLKDNTNKELENQVCRMDVCHYNFPDIINSVLIGIGQLKPVSSFEGCGSYTPGIKSSIIDEFEQISDTIKKIQSSKQTDKKNNMQAWLYFCFAKTLKEQVGLKQSLLTLLNEI